MSMKLPNGASLAISSAFATAFLISGISNASPAVAASVGHGQAAGDILLLDSGWEHLSDRVARVIAPTTDALSLEGIDTTDTGRYPIGMGQGSAKHVTTWVGIDQVLTTAFAGGEQQWWSYTYLEASQGKQEPTEKTPMSLTLTLGYDEDKPWYSALLACDRASDLRVLRMTLKSGRKLYYPVVVGFNGQPTLTKNEGMVVTVSMAINARFTRYAT